MSLEQYFNHISSRLQQHLCHKYLTFYKGCQSDLLYADDSTKTCVSSNLYLTQLAHHLLFKLSRIQYTTDVLKIVPWIRLTTLTMRPIPAFKTVLVLTGLSKTRSIALQTVLLTLSIKYQGLLEVVCKSVTRITMLYLQTELVSLLQAAPVLL